MKLDEPQRFVTSRSCVLPDEMADRVPPALRELFEFIALTDVAASSFQGRIKPLSATVSWLANRRGNLLSFRDQ